MLLRMRITRDYVPWARSDASPGLAKNAAIPYPALSAQIQRQTIKVRHMFLSKSGAQILQIVAFFLLYTVYMYMYVETRI